MSISSYDLVVLGGGNAVTVAIRAANAGWKVALVEKDLLGGTCPNRGCIPSKLLLAYADVATEIREAGRFHMEASLGAIDRQRIIRDTVAATLGATDGKIEGALPDGVTLLRGHGRFVDSHTLEVGGERVRGDRVLVAVGTRPREVQVPGLSGTPYWTSDHVFALDDLPSSITIVGGGYIACELAHFFQGVGVETTVLYRGTDLVRAEDPEIRAVFMEGFTKRVPVRFETTLAKVAHDASGFQLDLETGSGEASQHRSEALLFAIGRVPNTDDIGIEHTGLALDSRGFIDLNARLETTVEHIYALGDVKAHYHFTHAAAWEATYLADRLLDGKQGDLDYGPMPHAIFTMPEIAGVGETEDSLEKAGTPYLKAALPYTSAAKGRAIKEQHGLCKILLAPDGTILGCHIVGHHAATLLHEVIPVMKWRNHISSLTGIIHIHPSLSEVVRNTARRAEAML